MEIGSVASCRAPGQIGVGLQAAALADQIFWPSCNSRRCRPPIPAVPVAPRRCCRCRRARPARIIQRDARLLCGALHERGIGQGGQHLFGLDESSGVAWHGRWSCRMASRSVLVGVGPILIVTQTAAENEPIGHPPLVLEIGPKEWPNGQAHQRSCCAAHQKQERPRLQSCQASPTPERGKYQRAVKTSVRRAEGGARLERRAA